MRLRQQLILSYVPLLLIPIIVIGVITRNAAEYGLTLLVTVQGNRQATILANRFAGYYKQKHSWDGVVVLFDEPLPNPPFNPPLAQQGQSNANNQPGQQPRRGIQGILEPGAEQ